MYRFKYLQKVPLSLDECWDFFSSPANLKILTPPHLGFEMTGTDEVGKMYAGQMISYIIRPVLSLPIEWVTEITHVQEPDYFTDEQRVGPYKLWHHEHRFRAIDKGVEIMDDIHYKMPFGPLGKALHFLKVKKDIDGIFSYRNAKLEELFGLYKESGDQ